ncbi:MAG: methyltransferase, partial [Rickettsiales bacterium]|nr:methyltransferase [Rickettsiales bacterium]
VEKSAIGDVYENNILIKKSQNRQDILCPYYDKCGGCNLLHLIEKSYHDFKSKLCKTDNVIKIGFNTRQKVRFQIKNKKTGLFEKGTHNFIEIKNCLLLRPEINNIIHKLNFKANEIEVSVYDNGIGVYLLKNKEPIENLQKFLDENKEIIIVSYQNEMGTFFLQKQKPIVDLYGEKIEVKENIFLQATKEGQNAITEIIIENLKNFNNIIDLYCGIGTYTFPLSNYARIHSVEGSNIMIDIIKNNIKNRKITTEVRDLVKQPLLAKDFTKFDGVIINPPRSGANKQCQYLINSNIKKIVMVSCNPQTFWQDIETLKQKYHLEKVIGIDQFYATNHLEIIGILSIKNFKKN